MGVTYFIDNDPENGLSYSEEALKYNPYDYMTYFNVGYFYYKSSNYEDAEYYLQKAKEYSQNHDMINNIDAMLSEIENQL